MGKSNNTNIPLNRTLVVAQNFANICQMDRDKMKAPAVMTNNPLRPKDVQMIGDYCKEKKKSIFQFLFNEMYFDVQLKRMEKTYSSSDLKNLRDPAIREGLVILPQYFKEGWSYNIGGVRGPKGSLSNKEIPQKIYLATGAQSSIARNDKTEAYGMGVSSSKYTYFAQGIEATGICNGKDEKVQIMKRTRDSKPLESKEIVNDTDYYCSFMFFQPR